MTETRDTFPGIRQAWALLPTRLKVIALAVVVAAVTGWDVPEVLALLGEPSAAPVAEPAAEPSAPPCPVCPACADTDSDGGNA